jgi:hypothetical protein
VLDQFGFGMQIPLFTQWADRIFHKAPIGSQIHAWK